MSREDEIILNGVFFMVVIGILLSATFIRFFEPVYAYFTGKPLYVHLYILPKKLTPSQKRILESEFYFYKKLSPKRKVYFEHRLVKFINHYQFIGKEGFEINDRVRVLISATSIMITFGMRNYLYRVFDVIIVFPSQYLSTLSNQYHKGEFNPRVKAIVFSWEHFLEGYDITNDNLNLGIHEFTHALHFQGLKSEDVSATIFNKMFNQIKEEISHPPNKKRLMDSNFFRNYGFTNEFEFLAVVMEHFFESPSIFKMHFPELYLNVKKMINFRLDY